MEVSEVKLIKAEKYREVEDLAKTFFKTTKDHVEKVIKTNWKGFDKTIFQGTLPYVFVTSCFVGSMFLLVDAYKLLYQVEEHSENLEKLQRELNDLYQNKMRPTIRYTEEIINSSDEMIPENILKELIEKFQRMYNELKNILEKTESEKTKIKESQTNAKFLGICAAGVGAAVATTAWMFPPAGAVVAGGYILTGVFSATTAVLAFDSLRTLNEQEKQVKKLLHEIHKHKAELEKKFTEINLAFTEARRQRDLL